MKRFEVKEYINDGGFERAEVIDWSTGEMHETENYLAFVNLLKDLIIERGATYTYAMYAKDAMSRKTKYVKIQG